MYYGVDALRGDPLHVVGGKEFSEAYISTGNGSYFRICVSETPYTDRQPVLD